MKNMIKDLKQLRTDWENAAGGLDYRFSIFSAKDFSETTFKKSGEISAGILKDILKDLEIDVSDKVVVDYGCGAGRVTEYIAQFAKHVVAMDISDTMIKRFMERLGLIHNVSLFVGSGENLEPLPDNSVDIIYSLWVFQHIPETIVKKIVKDCYRVLKEHGILIFQMAIDKEHRSGVYKPLPAVSLSHWTKEEIKGLATQNKFKKMIEFVIGSNIYYAFQK